MINDKKEEPKFCHYRPKRVDACVAKQGGAWVSSESVDAAKIADISMTLAS